MARFTSFAACPGHLELAAPFQIAIHMNVNIQVDTLALPWKGAIKPGARERTCIYKRLLRGKAQLQLAEVAGVHCPPGARACPGHHVLRDVEIALTRAMSGQVHVTHKGGCSSTCQSHGHGNCHQQ